MLDCLILLEKSLVEAKNIVNIREHANYYRDEIVPCMTELRKIVDRLETFIADKYWSLPRYGEMLFGV